MEKRFYGVGRGKLNLNDFLISANSCAFEQCCGFAL
jgi:hypothetical protein